MSALRRLWQKAYRSLFGDIRPGEEKSVYTLLLIVFLLLVGYYVLKTVREPLILASGGAELKSYAAAAQAGMLLFLVPLYSFVTSRVDRRTLVIVVTVFFVACIQLFFFGSRLNRDRDELLEATPSIHAPFEKSPELTPEQVIVWDSGTERELTIRQQTPRSPLFALFFAVEDDVASSGKSLEDVIEVTIVPADEAGSGDDLKMQTPAFEGRGWRYETDARYTFKPQATAHDVTVRFLEDVGEVRMVGAQKARVPWLGFAFYVWVGIFSVAIISLFWSFANDIFERSAGERLFPVIAIGATAGAPVGSLLAGALFDVGVAPYAMLQITAGVLIVSLVLYQLVEQVRGDDVGGDDEIRGSSFGFDLIVKNNYLLLVALLMLLLNLVNTNGEYILGSMVEQMAHAKASAASVADPDAVFSQVTGSFYGTFYSIVNVVALLLQAFVVSRLVKYLGIRGVLFALPIVALGAYSVAAAGFGLAVFRWAKTAENATDYSVMNTGKAILWLPTTREEKYKAKQAIDTFIVRFGDMISAGFVFLGANVLSLGVPQFGLLNLGLTAAWVVLTAFIVREYRALAAAREKEVDPGEVV